MFQPFRRLLAAAYELVTCLMNLRDAVSDLTAATREQGPAIERLEALELSRHQWEAMCEGLLQKAEGKLKAANNAEARERANKKSYEHLIDPLAEVGDEPEAPHGTLVLGDDASPGEAERLSALRLGVAPTGKALATRAKFGVK